MATLTFLLVLVGFFFFYHTSERVELVRSLPVENWIYGHRQEAKWIGSLLWIGAVSLAMVIWGIASGLLFFSILVMTFASLVVILRPLQVISYKLVIGVLFFSILLENIV
ncbi:MAG: hypothetical protein ABJH98_11630 [Reichenbachiella sp.]|uniref:hypothetical protein n=1 Tax=Reichenbachiella sp. TaxID=2184521 RepID=UPI0032992E4F